MEQIFPDNFQRLFLDIFLEWMAFYSTPLKLYFFFNVFSVFFIHCSLCTHTVFISFSLCGKWKSFLKLKSWFWKTVQYSRFLSSRRSRNVKRVTKNYSLFAVVSLVHVLKYVTFHDVHLNITQFLCCSPKVFHSVIIRSLWLLVAVTQNEFLNHCHMKETERQKIRSKTESREYYTIVAT